MDDFIDNLDFLHINSKNAHKLIQAIANVCFALMLYDFCGGRIVFPKELSTKVIFEFFYSYQVIIPIIVYILTWAIFYWLIKTIIIHKILGFFVRFSDHFKGSKTMADLRKTIFEKRVSERLNS